MKVWAWLILLAVGPPAWGQSVKLPAEVKVPPGRLAAVTVEYDGDDVKWVTPPELDAFREYDPDPKKVRLRLIGYTAGRYQVHAIAAKGGKLSDFATSTVIVGDPGPSPGPGPGPVPPPPDQLTAALQGAYDGEADAEKSTHKGRLAALYRQAAALLESNTFISTWGDLDTKIRAAATTLGVSGKLRGVQLAIREELIKHLPTDPVAPFTADDRAKAVTQYKRVAAALEGVR